MACLLSFRDRSSGRAVATVGSAWALGTRDPQPRARATARIVDEIPGLSADEKVCASHAIKVTAGAFFDDACGVKLGES